MKLSLFVGASNIIALPLAISHSKQQENDETNITIVFHILFFLIGVDIYI
jgi:hypothetical protein